MHCNSTHVVCSNARCNGKSPPLARMENIIGTNEVYMGEGVDIVDQEK